uniref:Uncharacterized protein n=1 Tax=Timema douglasi TaxID=61478 RepID=A0A7R8VDL7_TIMDO|nr:unnamed protein product [Timema douglasi]
MFSFFKRQKPSVADADKEQPSSSTASPLAPPRRKDDTTRDKGREMGPTVKALPTGVKKKGDAMSSWSPWSFQGGVESPEEVLKRPVTHSQDPITRRTDVPTIVISSSCSPRTSPVRSTSSVGMETQRDDSTPGVKLETNDSVVPRPLSDSANVALTSVGKDERMEGDIGVVKLTAANVVRHSEAKEEVRKETFSKPSASTAGLVKSPLPTQPPAIFSQTGVVNSRPVTSVLPTPLPQPSVSSRTATSNLQEGPDSTTTYIKPTTFPHSPSIQPEETSQSSISSQLTSSVQRQPAYPLSSDNKKLNVRASPAPVKDDAKSSKDTSEELIKRQEELQRLKEAWELEKDEEGDSEEITRIVVEKGGKTTMMINHQAEIRAPGNENSVY